MPSDSSGMGSTRPLHAREWILSRGWGCQGEVGEAAVVRLWAGGSAFIRRFEPVRRTHKLGSSGKRVLFAVRRSELEHEEVHVPASVRLPFYGPRFVVVPFERPG